MAGRAMIRREVLQGLGALALWPGTARAAAAVPFSEERLRALAREVAAQAPCPAPDGAPRVARHRL